MTELEQSMQIAPSSGLAPDEIELLIMEAESSVEKDRTAKEFILHRNRLNSLIKNTGKAMMEFGKSIPLEEQQEINAVLNEAEESLESEDGGEIQTQLSKVETVANQLTEALMAAV
ncbi:MAG TPA: Hsp70 family protein [Pyrinomonadaceae bacterium]|nr:Hsp70 family protein [Pyrinomonadaceae bacterium]